MDQAPPSRAPFLRRLRDHLSAPIDIASLVYFRIAFGAIMVWEVYRYFNYGWIDDYWIDPVFNFTYACFRWVEPWPGDGMYFHMAGLGILAAFIMIGFMYRLSTILFFFGFSYVFLLEKAHYLNHFYFIILVSFLMIFVPAHRSLSVDAHVWRHIRSRVAPAWGLWSLRIQLGMVYFFGGVAKINADWLRGEPVRMWLADMDDYAVIGPHVDKEWFVYGVAYGGLLFDLLVVPALLWKRTRWLAFGAAAFFHIMNSWFFHIGIFPWFSLAATAIYFRPDWPRLVWSWLAGQKTVKKKGKPTEEQRPDRWNKPILAMLAVFFAIQVYLPFRHWLYPGDVNWTEEGHRFSWHMKLRSKYADVEFFARDPATGDVFEIDARERINSRQFRKMSGRPDMILEFARYIAGEMEANGIPNAQVRVRATAGLNGREPQLLIDPRADLTKVKWGLAPSKWVVPLTTPLKQDRTRGEPVPDGDDGFIRRTN